MAEVRWTLAAQSDLQDIEEFIARDSLVQAVNFVDQLIDSTDKLTTNPQIGRVVPEFERQELREVLFKSYRIIYLLREDMVYILRVVHGARDLRASVQREPWELE
jgi:plasmid stabilization system protein ParE